MSDEAGARELYKLYTPDELRALIRQAELALAWLQEDEEKVSK